MSSIESISESIIGENDTEKSNIERRHESFSQNSFTDATSDYSLSYSDENRSDTDTISEELPDASEYQLSKSRREKNAPNSNYSSRNPNIRKPIRDNSARSSYSEDFEPTTHQDSDIHASVPFDWSFKSSYSRTPRRTVRARSLELLTARSTETIFDSRALETSIARNRSALSRYSTDTAFGYTESFDSLSDYSDTQRDESVTESTIQTVSSPQETSSEVTETVTEGSQSEGSDSYTAFSETCSEEEVNETPQMKQISDDMRYQFLSQKLKVLKRARETHKDKTPKPKPDKFEETFCRRRLNILKTKLKGGHIGSSVKPQEVLLKYAKETTVKNVESLGINPSVINRLKTENTLSKMRNSASEDVHVPSECKTCKKQVTDMALNEFTSRKKTVLQNNTFDECLADASYFYGDPVALIGQSAKELPSYKENTAEIFKNLLQPWNTKIWGSKLLRNEDEKQDVSRTKGKDIFKGNIEPREKGSTCPRSILYKENNSEIGHSRSGCEKQGSNIQGFDRGTSLPKTERTISSKNVFEILNEKLQEMGYGENTESSFSFNSDLYPDDETWTELRKTISCTPRNPKTPATAKNEQVPVNSGIPTGRSEFWKHYFAPLNKAGFNSIQNQSVGSQVD